MKTYSLRLRILLGVLGAVAVAWALVAFIAYREARHEAEEVFDAHLAQSAMLLFAIPGEKIPAAGHSGQAGEHSPPHRYDKKVAFQIWEGDRLLAHSQWAPHTRLSAQESGFSDVRIDGQAWRVYSARDGEQRFLVQVADAIKSRNALSKEIASHLLLPLFFCLLLLGAALGAFVFVAFRPLARLADSIAGQAPLRLHAIELHHAPREIVPILERLNRLFSEVRRAQEDERRFTADAAHELRTPLAVLQTHAEVACAATDAATRQRALTHLLNGSRRAAHLIEQLLMLARLDAQAGLPEKQTCCLHSLLVETVATLIPAALEKEIDVEITPLEVCGQGGAATLIDGIPLLLQALVRNLVDNAIRYTPQGGQIRIALLRENHRLLLQVRDNGPGLPQTAYHEPPARFRRYENSGGSSGHGLGLSIVARIAELHGATLTLAAATPEGGLAVTVAFGLPA